MARYITSNREGYIFSAITASIDAEVRFEPLASGAEGNRVGLLHIPMSARFIINDGQHRRAAIEMALRDCPEVGDETIAVVLFLDVGLKRCQQMFADLNRYAVRPSRSIGVLYDHRDDAAELARLVVLSLPVFRDVVEMERSTLSLRSRKLFTLSAIYSATTALVSGYDGAKQFEDKRELASEFWEEISKQFPEWQLVRERKITAGEVRQEYIHSHGIVLQALGKAGNSLLRDASNHWRTRLKALKKLDWTRANTKLWEGRAMLGGRVQKAEQNVTLTTNLIKRFLKLQLTPEEAGTPTDNRRVLAVCAAPGSAREQSRPKQDSAPRRPVPHSSRVTREVEIVEITSLGPTPAVWPDRPEESVSWAATAAHGHPRPAP